MAAYERVSTVLTPVIPLRVDRAVQVDDPENPLTDVTTGQPSTIDIRKTRLPSILSDTSLSDFDPRDHRHPKAPIKVWMAYFNLVRAGMGAGMVGFPVAMSQAGIVLGPILAVLTAFLLIHTQSNLLNTMNKISLHLRISHIPYRYAFRLAILHGPQVFRFMGEVGPFLVATFMVLSQLGTCTIFVILTTDSVRDMMDWDSNLPAILTLLPAYLILEYYMKNLRIITYISMISNLFHALGQSLVFYLIFLNPKDFKIRYATAEPLPLAFAFGIFVFNLSGLGVIIALDRNLAKPIIMTKPWGVIQVGVLLPTIVALVFGCLGYWSFGTMDENVLRFLPYDEMASMACMGFYLIALMLTYPINCYPAIWIITDILNNLDADGFDKKTVKILESIARPTFVVTSFFICYLVPFQSCFVAFVGSLCSSMMSLVFPTIIELDYGSPGLQKFSDRLLEAACDPRAGQYLAQRISIAIQRGNNAASVFGTLPTGIDMDQLSYLKIVCNSLQLSQLFQLAAFEAVSRFHIQPIGQTDHIDIREARLDSDLSGSLDEFDPRDHRKPFVPIKPWMAYLNLLRTELGAGVLGIPLAISQTGIIFGPILSLSICLLLIHMHVTLLNILNNISSHLRIPHISYRYGFRLALLHGPRILRPLGRCGPFLVAVFMILSQLGICTVFVIFTADSLRDIMDWDSNRPAIFTLIIPYLLLEYYTKNLKIVSYISLVGTGFNVLGLILATYHIFTKPRNDTITIMTTPLPLMFSFGSILFNQSAIGVILSLEKSLTNARIMTARYGVINVGLLVPTVIATVFGTVAYWSFGTMEENVLRSLPYDANTAMVSFGLYMVAIAMAYPIQCYPAISIIMEVIRSSDAYYDSNDPNDAKVMKFIENISRPLFVLLTFVVCYLVPFQGPFVAFVGSICTTILALVFPALMEISMMYPGPYGKYNFYLIKDLVVILVGMGSFVFGAVLCGYLIYIRILTMKSRNGEDF